MTASNDPNRSVDVNGLRRTVKGPVLGPGDPGYDEGRALFYGWLDRRPSAIVQVADATDVANVIRHARSRGCELSVRSGGHSGAGHSVCDHGIVIDVSRMKAISVDVDGGTAWAETGLTAGQYLMATSEHGLATGFGDAGTVGIGGITLGGGMGFLSRKFGLTIDELLAAELVLADGSFVAVDAEHDPELFWAVRGGGGNFGVATRFRFRLRQVDRVVGGMMFQPGTPAVIRDLMDLAGSAPDELSMIINVGMFPPMPFLPAESQGRPVVMTMLVHCGAPEEGERTAARLRAIAAPYADMVRTMRYREMFEGPEGPHPAAGSFRSMYLDRFDISDAEAIVDGLQRSAASMRVVQLRPLGGAMDRVPADATAYAHRGRAILANVAALYDRPADAPAHEAWVVEVSDRLRKGNGAVYVNFLGNEGPQRVRDAYPGRTYERLAAVKAAVDPDNVFRGNHNILPAPR